MLTKSNINIYKDKNSPLTITIIITVIIITTIIIIIPGRVVTFSKFLYTNCSC